MLRPGEGGDTQTPDLIYSWGDFKTVPGEVYL